MQRIEETGAAEPDKTDDRMAEATRKALGMLDELEPRTGTEALLAAQMIGTQRLAMRCLERAAADGQTFDGVNANIARATRLMRLFNDQVETMARLKGTSGRQRVVVEHVTVSAGSQVIVGTVIPRDSKGRDTDAN